MEGEKDFTIVRHFAKILGHRELAAGLDITTVSSDGQSSKERVKNLTWAFQKTLSMPLAIAAVYDRDFLSEEEVSENIRQLSLDLSLVHYLQRKEIENYLLVPSVLERAFQSALEDKERRTGIKNSSPLNIRATLSEIVEGQKSYLLSQYISCRVDFLKRGKQSTATLTQETVELFESSWSNDAAKINIISGKQALRDLRARIQDKYKISITDYRIVESFQRNEIPEDLVNLIELLESFRTCKPDLATRNAVKTTL